MGSPRYVIEKTENTERVMTSCMVLSCAALNSYEPSRLAGTWKQYSKNAMPQLVMITFHRATLRNFKCPYQANVMNMFEMVRRRIVRMRPVDSSKDIRSIRSDSRGSRNQLIMRYQAFELLHSIF